VEVGRGARDLLEGDDLDGLPGRQRHLADVLGVIRLRTMFELLHDPLIGMPRRNLRVLVAPSMRRPAAFVALPCLVQQPRGASMPFGIGPLELIIVLVIALVVFGPKRLPDLGRSLGTGMREFKDSITSSSKSDEDDPAAVTAARSDDPAKPDDAVGRPRG
jgi:sec-independent protein translocase protein TatA